MTISERLRRAAAQPRLIADSVRLPRARLRFEAALNPELIGRMRALFAVYRPRIRAIAWSPTMSPSHPPPTEVTMINTLAHQCRLVLDVARLPVAQLCFDTRYDPDDVRETHRRFTSPHPKYKIFGHKQLGVALIDLRRHAEAGDSVESITGLRGAATYVSKARRRGYTLAQIDRNEHVEAIHEINISLSSRQGRPMDATYLDKKTVYQPRSHYRYFGVFSKQRKLMAYCNIGRYGNFAAFSQLIGFRNNDGIMHLMVSDIIALLLREREAGDGPDYLMYDTFFGAQPGMRQFKTMLGFTPYRVRYTLR